MTFVAQSLLIRNIQVDYRPRFILIQCRSHRHEIHWLFRKLSMWYIENYGISVATGFLHYIITDARENPNIEIME
jgi:CRISPR/Cas system-associated exonuclease Cas4 (RecB family)